MQQLTAAGHHLSAYEVERALIDAQGVAERRFEYATSPDLVSDLMDLRMRLSTGSSLAAIEAKARYDLIHDIVSEVETRDPPRITVRERLDRITNHPIVGSMLFVLVMATVFQAVFSWATPLMNLIDCGDDVAGRRWCGPPCRPGR